MTNKQSIWNGHRSSKTTKTFISPLDPVPAVDSLLGQYAIKKREAFEETLGQIKNCVLQHYFQISVGGRRRRRKRNAKFNNSKSNTGSNNSYNIPFSGTK
jgi:hypothetical protein